MKLTLTMRVPMTLEGAPPLTPDDLEEFRRFLQEEVRKQYGVESVRLESINTTMTIDGRDVELVGITEEA